MKTAEIFANLSTAKKLKVGAIVVKENRIISIGYNGTPSGWDNTCEDKLRVHEESSLDLAEVNEKYPYEELHEDTGQKVRYGLKTKPEVLHAERNALDKLARGHESGLGAIMFVTHSPCLECAKSIYGTGIKELIYKNEYRSTDGIQFLKKCGIKVKKLEG